MKYTPHDASDNPNSGWRTEAGPPALKITSEMAVESQPYRFTAFASDLGLKPGEWPETIDTDLGNGQAFVLTGGEGYGETELAAMHYRQQLGCISLAILND